MTSPAPKPPLPHSDGATAWHAADTARAAAELGVDPRKGLGAGEIRRRLACFGPNRLAEKPPPSPWLLFVSQYESFFMLILGAAAVLAFAIGHLLDAAVILLVVNINAVLGFLQERRAEQAAAALKSMLATRCRVRREGRVERISAADLVPGDVVLLEAGDRVPVDGRLVVAHSLEVDESTLTGESLPVGKAADVVLEPDAPLPERRNLAFMNTLVTRGRGELLAAATGMRTEVGRLAAMLEQAAEGATPLQRQLDRLGKRLAAIAVMAVALVFGFGVLRGEEIGQLVLTSLALAVAAIPEGLPAVVTVTLAFGMHRMARQCAIVKRLASVETLGCTTLICSDKTGTLTRNRMAPRAVCCRGRRVSLDPEGPGGRGAEPSEDLEPVLLPICLCNDGSIRPGEQIGDPTEAALLTLAQEAGVDRDRLESRLPRIAEVPFDSATKLMATFHQDGDAVRVFVKGAPEILLQRCNTLLGPQGVGPLKQESPQHPARENQELAASALRVLGVASRTLTAAEFSAASDPSAHLSDLTFLGLIGLMDTPRPEAYQALAECKAAGIRVKMVTGDQAATALAIARELGLEGEVVSGAELDTMDERELARRFDTIGVFARVGPEHKLKLVRAAKARGHVVAMTGDGVNDAPALKSADIGVAMGECGTEVAKEAADIVLADDNFATIVRAVREGRTIYENIGKFVRYQLSTNFGAVLAVFTAPLLGLPLPFNAIQILWVNIIMDGPPALALGLDPPPRGIMDAPPRSSGERILSLRRLVKLLGFGAVMAAGTLGVLHYGLQTGPPQRALTMGFTTFVLFQFFNVFNARAERGTALGPQLFTNWRLWAALGVVLTLQLLATNWSPAQTIFHTAELSAGEFLLAAGVAASILVLEEARKLAVRAASRLRRASRGR